MSIPIACFLPAHSAFAAQQIFFRHLSRRGPTFCAIRHGQEPGLLEENCGPNGRIGLIEDLWWLAEPSAADANSGSPPRAKEPTMSSFRARPAESCQPPPEPDPLRPDGAASTGRRSSLSHAVQ